jgi:hypothetical protein
MDQEKIAEAFCLGMYKKAAEYGLEKAAFLPAAVAFAVRNVLPMVGMLKTPEAVAALAKRKGLLGRTAGVLNKGLTHKNPWINASANVGTQLATTPLLYGGAGMVADAIHKPEEPQQYPQQYTT